MTGAGVEFYRHSGKTGPGVVLVPVFMVPIALLLAFVYTYAIVYIPFVGYLSFKLVHKVLDDKGNKQDKETALITNMLISGEQHRQLLQLKATRSAAVAVAEDGAVTAADAMAEPPEPPAGEIGAGGTD